MISFVDGHWWSILLGNSLLSSSMPLYVSYMTQFTNTWFTDKERTFVTSICGLCVPGGTLFGFIFAGIIYHGITVSSSKEEII